MAKKDKSKDCCDTQHPDSYPCKVESLVNIDERGQMVLPKELRDKANIRAGDKLAVISWENDGKICCFTLIKASELGGMVTGLLGPMMKEVK